jgi:hypothetical protein
MDHLAGLTEAIHELDPEVVDAAPAPSPMADPVAQVAPFEATDEQPPADAEGAPSTIEPASTVIFLPSPPVDPPDPDDLVHTGSAVASSDEVHDSLSTALERLSRWTTSSH